MSNFDTVEHIGRTIKAKLVYITNKGDFKEQYIKGTVLNILPSDKVPTDSEMIQFYGNKWKNAKAQKALKFDRYLIRTFSGNKIVIPMNDKIQPLCTIE